MKKFWKTVEESIDIYLPGIAIAVVLLIFLVAVGRV